MQQIISEQTILAASEGSYLEDGRASAGWALYEPSEECDSEGRIVPSVKILFGSLDSNSAYRAEAVSIFTVTIVLHFLGLYLEQQQIDTSLICDNKGLVKCIKKYTDYNTKHITADMTEADIILLTIHFSKQLNYSLK